MRPPRSPEAERLGHPPWRLDTGPTWSDSRPTKPRLLLLDEPAAGLAPDETKKMVVLVRKLKGRYTIILIEHKIDVVMSMSDRISVMHFGSVIAEGVPGGDSAKRRGAARLPRGIAPP